MKEYELYSYNRIDLCWWVFLPLVYSNVAIAVQEIHKEEKNKNMGYISAIRKEKVPTKFDKIKISLLVVLAISLFLYDNQTAIELMGIRSLYGKNSGTYCFYVEIERLGEKFTLPGEITVEVDVDDDGTGHADYTNMYYVNKVYFPDGDYLDFSQRGDNYLYNFDETTFVYDQYGNDWDIRILNEHAYCDQVKEKSSVTIYSVIELFLMLSIAIYNLIGYLCWDEKSMEEHGR